LMVTEIVHVWAAQALGTRFSRSSRGGEHPRRAREHRRALGLMGNDALVSVLFVALVYVVFRLVLHGRGWRCWRARAHHRGVERRHGGQRRLGRARLRDGADRAHLRRHLRFGLLAVAVALFADDMVTGAPLTLHTSAWFATPSTLTLACLVALSLFGFYASRAGQPLFGRGLELPRT